MKVLSRTIAIVVLAACTRQEMLCEDVESCSRLMEKRIASDLALPDAVGKFGKLDVWMGFDEEGNMHTHQVMLSPGQPDIGQHFVAAIRVASPFVEIKGHLARDYDTFKRIKLSFYDYRSGELYSGKTFDMTAARQHADFLNSLSKDDIVRIFGEPNEKKTCQDIYQDSYDCWRYIGAAKGQSGESRDLHVLFSRDRLYAVSNNYNGSKPDDIPNTNEISNLLDDVAATIGHLGKPYLVLPGKDSSSFSLQYNVGSTRDGEWFPGASISYWNGAFNSLSFVLIGRKPVDK